MNYIASSLYSGGLVCFRAFEGSGLFPLHLISPQNEMLPLRKMFFSKFWVIATYFIFSMIL